MKTWRHARKGLITGTVERVSGDWTYIRVEGEHKPKMVSEAHRGTVWDDGEVVQVRTSLLTEI